MLKLMTKELRLQDQINRLQQQLEESQYEEWERGKEIVLFEKMFNAHKDQLTESYVEAIEVILKKFDNRCLMPSKEPERPLDNKAKNRVYQYGVDRGIRKANGRVLKLIMEDYTLTPKK